MRKLIALMLLLFIPHANASHRSLCSGFLPENEMRFPISESFAGQKATGISKAQFDAVLDAIDGEYANEIASLGASFKIERFWKDPVANAYAYQSGKDWFIAMYGGLARHPAMTPDGFMAVACHEVGHHLGGAPKFRDDDWGSVEGQADYYATLKCLRRMFLRADNARVLRKMKLDPVAVKRCRAERLGKQDEYICVRGAMAGANLASVLSVMGKEKLPSLSTPDTTKVLETDENHPRAQCRMDTYLQGAICRVPFAARLDNKDYRTGTCADESFYQDGVRPSCWFAK